MPLAEYKGRSVLITGGLGFIGSNLARRLVDLGDVEVIIVDALIPGQRALPVAERVVNRILSLPLYPQLQEQEVRAVAKAIVEFENRN